MISDNSYIWIEYGALLPNGKMVRNQFFRIDDPDTLKLWRMQFDNRDIFTSVCIYAEPKRNSAFIAPMYFDLDNPSNLEQAKVDALGLCQMLTNNATVPEECLDICFTGFKGFAIVVPCVVFNPQSPEKMLMLYKRMAEKATAGGLMSVDVGIYDSSRLWRISNSLNSKSGRLFKIPLSHKELQELSIEQIKNLAKAPRGDDSFALPSFCQATADWYRKAVSVLKKESKLPPAHRQMNLDFKKGWRMVPCVKAIEETTLPDGIRHPLYFALCRYFSFLGMHHEEIRERIMKIDTRNSIHDTEYIERTIMWGCNNPGFAGCNKTVFSKYCKKDGCFYAKLKEK